MSHIPNSAMPHAEAAPEPQTTDGSGASESRFGQIADKVREHPKTAAAAGAAVAAGLVAAAAIPAMRARGRGKDGGKSSGKRSG
jgi:hypothetical protein